MANDWPALLVVSLPFRLKRVYFNQLLPYRPVDLSPYQLTIKWICFSLLSYLFQIIQSKADEMIWRRLVTCSCTSSEAAYPGRAWRYYHFTFDINHTLAHHTAQHRAITFPSVLLHLSVHFLFLFQVDSGTESHCSQHHPLTDNIFRPFAYVYVC